MNERDIDGGSDAIQAAQWVTRSRAGLDAVAGYSRVRSITRRSRPWSSSSRFE